METGKWEKSKEENVERNEKETNVGRRKGGIKTKRNEAERREGTRGRVINGKYEKSKEENIERNEKEQT